MICLIFIIILTLRKQERRHTVDINNILDAVESLVNIIIALYSLRQAYKKGKAPTDNNDKK